jgi:hypothetical protein
VLRLLPAAGYRGASAKDFSCRAKRPVTARRLRARSILGARRVLILGGRVESKDKRRFWYILGVVIRRSNLGPQQIYRASRPSSQLNSRNISALKLLPRFKNRF